MEKKRIPLVGIIIKLIFISFLSIAIYTSTVSSAVVNGGSHPANGENGEYIPLQDVIPPYIRDDTESVAYTGESFSFVSYIEDYESNLSSVWVQYWFEAGSRTNLSMNAVSNNIYQYDFVVGNSLKSLYYVISATDTAHNWNNTDITIVVVQDNDMPEIWDVMAKPSYMNGGGSVNISAKIRDNLWIDEVLLYVVYPDKSIEIISLVDNFARNVYFFNQSYVQTGEYVFYFIVNDTSKNSIRSEDYFFILNSVPDIPVIPVGSCMGTCGVSYDYTTSAIDAEGDSVYFLWDWGDGNFSEWVGPYSSEEVVTSSYVWCEIGNYEIRVKARDVYGVESLWSDPFRISMPGDDEVLYQKISALCMWYSFNPHFGSLNVFLRLFL